MVDIIKYIVHWRLGVGTVFTHSILSSDWTDEWELWLVLMVFVNTQVYSGLDGAVGAELLSVSWDS